MSSASPSREAAAATPAVVSEGRASPVRSRAAAFDSDRRQILLSNLPPGPQQRRLAAIVVLVLVVAFVATVPFVAIPLARIEAFIPAYQTALLVNDLITAALLLSQFSILRTRALLVLACAYLFTAFIVVPHALTLPGLLGPTGVFGAGLQSTAWLWLFWHTVFPSLVIVYALTKDSDPPAAAATRSAFGEIAIGLVAVAVAIVAFTWLATEGEPLLPQIMQDGTRMAPLLRYAAGVLCLICAVALVLLWLRRRSALDLWVMVVLCAWLCEIPLSAMLNPGRYSLGFYAGRIFGLLAATFVLLVLLAEITAIYARLVRSVADERRERQRRFNEMQAVLAQHARVSELGRMAMSLAHEVKQPLTAIGNYLAGMRRLIETGRSAMIGDAIQAAQGQTRRASDLVDHLRDFVGRREVDQRAQDLPASIDQAVRLAQVGTVPLALDVERQFDPTAERAVFDRVQIEQVLFNLVRNAIEAMAASPSPRVTISTRRKVGGLVEIVVADTGPGLDPQVRARLFEPFVSTKSQGMGVGLSICRFIVEAHGGTLDAGDNPGGGTVFRFTVPAAPADEVGEA